MLKRLSKPYSTRLKQQTTISRTLDKPNNIQPIPCQSCGGVDWEEEEIKKHRKWLDAYITKARS